MRRIVTFRAVERDPLLAAVVSGAVLAGVLLRIWILTSPLGTLDADEAVIGLMAREVTSGHLTVFFWGQEYGGSQEALLTGLLFAIAGQSVVALKLVPVALYALATVLVWRVGRRTVGEPGATLAAALAWIWPPFPLWWSTKARGFYGIGLVSTMLVILFALRLRERDSRLDAAVLGLALGAGWWATPLTVLFALPVVGWLVWARPRVVRLGWATGAGFLFAASPWFIRNVRGGGGSLHMKAFVTSKTTYSGRLDDFVTNVLPSWLGLRIPYAPQWLLGPAVGGMALAVVVGAVAAVGLRRRAQLAPLLAIAASFPLTYAITGFGAQHEPRYLTFLVPVVALPAGWLLARRRVLAPVGLIVALGFSTLVLIRMDRWGLYKPRAPDVVVPQDVSPAIDLLEREGIHAVESDYWLAYRIAFASQERVIVATPYTQRNAHWQRRVASERLHPWLFLRGSRTEVEARPLLTTRGYRRIESGDYVLYVPPSA